MKKICLLITTVFIITSCINTNQVYKETNTNFNNESEIQLYNFYMETYNTTTKIFNKILIQYDNLLSLNDRPTFNEDANLKVNVPYEDFNSFYNTITNPKFDLNSVQNDSIKNSYLKLTETIEPIYEFYNKTFSYYDKAIFEKNPDNVIIYENLHKNFILSYSYFKNSYLDFHNEITKLHDFYKYEYILFLEDENLHIHNHLSKTILFLDELIDILNDDGNYKFKDVLTKNIEYINNEIGFLLGVKEKDANKYFYDNEIFINSFYETVDILKILKDLNKDILKLNNGNYKDIAKKYIDIRNKLIENHNHISI